jgi:V8-like Glu-specific endopeptidase
LIYLFILFILNKKDTTVQERSEKVRRYWVILVAILVSFYAVVSSLMDFKGRHVAGTAKNHESILYVDVHINDGSSVGCSGFLVSKQVALTAAHCLIPKSGKVDEALVAVMEEGGKYRTLGVSRYSLSSRYNQTTSEYDYAALFLNSPVDREPYKVATYQGNKGDLVVTTNFPGHKQKKKHLEMWEYTLIVDEIRRKSHNKLHMIGPAYHGQSGATFSVNGEKVAYGVLSQGDNGPLFQTFDKPALKEISEWKRLSK